MLVTVAFFFFALGVVRCADVDTGRIANTTAARFDNMPPRMIKVPQESGSEESTNVNEDEVSDDHLQRESVESKLNGLIVKGDDLTLLQDGIVDLDGMMQKEKWDKTDLSSKELHQEGQSVEMLELEVANVSHLSRDEDDIDVNSSTIAINPHEQNESLAPEDEYESLNAMKEGSLIPVDVDIEELKQHSTFHGELFNIPLEAILNDESRMQRSDRADKHMVSLAPNEQPSSPLDDTIHGFEWFNGDEQRKDFSHGGSDSGQGFRSTKIEAPGMEQDEGMSLDQPIALPNVHRQASDRFGVSEEYGRPGDRHSVHYGYHSHYEQARNGLVRRPADQYSFSPRLLQKFHHDPFINPTEPRAYFGSTMQWRRLPQWPRMHQFYQQPNKYLMSVHEVSKELPEDGRIEFQGSTSIDTAITTTPENNNIEGFIEEDSSEIFKTNVNLTDDDLKEFPEVDLPEVDSVKMRESDNNETSDAQVQVLWESESEQDKRNTSGVVRDSGGRSLGVLLRLVTGQLGERLRERRFSGWHVLGAVAVSVATVLLGCGALAGIQHLLRHHRPRSHCCFARTQYSPSIKQASSNNTIYDVDYTLDSLRMERSRKQRRGFLWSAFCPLKANAHSRSGANSQLSSSHSSSSPSLRSTTDISVVSADMGTQYEHSDAMISSFVTNDLIVELNDRDSTYTAATEGFEYYGGGEHSARGATLPHTHTNTPYNAQPRIFATHAVHKDYKIGITEF
jgi:hypothetical protein